MTTGVDRIAAEEPSPSTFSRKTPIEPPRVAWMKYSLGITAFAAVLLVLYDSPYWLNLFTMALLFAGLAASWNIIGGFGGQFSLGHGVFFAVGAYTVAILYTRAGVSPWIGLFPAMLLSMLVAATMSWPTFRLKGPFFAIATMALNEVAFALSNYFSDVTGGPRGVRVPFEASVANMLLPERWIYTLIVLGYVALVTAVAISIKRSYLGYCLFAVRDDDEAASAIGINVLATKMQGMLISAALTAMGGGIFVMYVRFIDPPTLLSLPDVGLRFALLSLIGGIGTVAGPVIGALLVQPGATFLRGSLEELSPGTHLIVLGALMVLAAVFFRGGIVGFIDNTYRRFASRSQP